jgi:hypothetical protein
MKNMVRGLLVVMLAGCGAAPMVPVDAGSVPDGGVAADAGMLDHSAAGLTAFAKSGAYKSWKAEAAVHASTGPHGGNVRTYVNDVLHASLKAGKTTHPPGSVTVKELYGSGTTTITGYAVDAKDSNGTWYFLEAFAPTFSNPYYFVGTSNFCASCHSSGPDYYASPISALPP